MRPRLPLLGVALLASVAMASRRSVPVAPNGPGGSAPCNLSGWWDHDTRVVQHGARVASSADYGTGEGTFNAARLELVMNFSNRPPSAPPLHGAVSADCDTVSWSTGIWRRQPKPPPLRVFPHCPAPGPPYQPGVAELPVDCPLDVSPKGHSASRVSTATTTRPRYTRTPGTRASYARVCCSAAGPIPTLAK